MTRDLFDVLARSAAAMDILMEIERVLDGLDLYVDDAWERAEILAGPHLGRHDVTVALAFDPARPPSAAGLARLRAAGVRVALRPARLEWREDRQRARTVYGGVLGDTPDSTLRRNLSTRPLPKARPLLVVELAFPRRMVDLPLRARARRAADAVSADFVPPRAEREAQEAAP